MERKMPSKRQWMATNRIKVRAPFNSLFPVDQKTVVAVAEHMEANGYDQSQPIVLWKEKLDEERNQAIIIDGHTRLLAAKKIGLSPVYIARVSFPDRESALRYAIHNQRDRRNLTDADLIRCVQAVDKRKRQGERTDLASSDAKLGKSAEETARIVGTSPRKVEKARTILDHADEETKQAVLDGEKSIHAAAKETQEKRKGKVKPESKLVDREFKQACSTFLDVVRRLKLNKWKKMPQRDVVHDIENIFYLAILGTPLEHKVDVIWKD